MTDIIVLHEYGAPSHYLGLQHSSLGSLVVFREFSILRQFLRGLKNLDVCLITKSINNLLWLLKCFFLKPKDKIIILGIAPFDWRARILVYLFKNCTILWHNSWVDWSSESFPKGDKFSSKFYWENIFFHIIKGGAFVTEKSKASFQLKYGAIFPIQVVYHSCPDYFYKSTISINKAKDSFKVGFVGRLEHHKGVLSLLKLANYSYNFEISFHIAGSGNLKNKIINSNTNSKIVYWGQLDASDLKEFYSTIDVLLVPSIKSGSWEEAFGLSIIEAMASGVVPICTDHGGPLEILADTPLEKFIFPECSYVEQAYNSICYLWYTPSVLNKSSATAFEISKKFNKNSIKSHWDDLLKNSQANDRLL